MRAPGEMPYGYALETALDELATKQFHARRRSSPSDRVQFALGAQFVEVRILTIHSISSSG